VTILGAGTYMLSHQGGLYTACTDLVNTKAGQEKISFGRDNSDAGHIKYLCQGIVLLIDNPIWGIGASTVGPASYHLGDEKDHFNTENQYLQIYLEYGLL
jgi:hypothetical protein